MSKTSDSNLNLISASDIKPASPDIEMVRRRLAEAKGPKYWRTLEELADEKAFGELLHREFPRQASEWVDPVTRRNFLKLAGASLAMAGLAGCTKQPLEPIVPYVRQPEDLVPGKPMFYATAMPFAGYGIPLLVESHEFRPTKIEGNREHPASLGASEIFSQASILNLYDPDRAATITHMGDSKPWGEFLKVMGLHVGDPEGVPEGIQRKLKGAGLRFLTGATSSPTMGWQMKEVLRQFPQAKWHRYEAVHRDSARAGSKLAFGAVYDSIYKFAAADVVVSLDADFLSGAWFPGFVGYARDFMGRRKMTPGEEMNRLYVAESSPSTTGMKADHRLSVRPSEVEKIARALAAKAGVSGVTAPQLSAEMQRWVEAVSADLKDRHGKCLLVPGDFQSPAVHALAHAMNSALGNVGQTVVYIDPVEVEPVEHTASIRELVADINAGHVDTLVMIGVNPVYDAPADLNFKDALKKLLEDNQSPRLIVHVSQRLDDTSEYAHWHIPETHYLEAWSDVRAHDGAISIVQPLLLPLYDGKSAHEILAIFTGQPGASGYDTVRSYWQTQHTGPDFEEWWRRSVHDGFMKDSASPARAVTVKLGVLPPAAPAGDVEIAFRPDPCIYDGRFVNNGWLQETPKPLTRVTWDNVAMISPAMAARMGLKQLEDYGDHQSDAQNVIEIELQGRKVKAPFWPQPGHPDNTVTLFLGYGQKNAGRIGSNHGYNANALRTTAAQYTAQGAKVSDRPGEHWDVAVTQGHFSMENRDPVKAVTLAEFRKDPLYAVKEKESGKITGPGKDESLYPDYRESQHYYEKYAWGMAIDLNSCIGCQTCAVACQAENSISIVGKDQVQRGREMQWIRVDAYYEGSPANPRAHFQPVPCMQCENAPCEPVCPVGATLHSTEGLNEMVYNRCVGTRYCSNNCPYKVRRFNFLLYADWDTPSLKMMRNPDVSVRSRGVMEKCTYCVQRINEARITAEKKVGPNGEEVLIQDGEILTACQQACPTGAIVFGNINDKESRVAKLKADPRNYSLLAELNTRPRTTYIGAVLNPNPDLGPGEKA
ncbi:MAG TPA: TAT-variant-translocated molybdopterin oxidoreductase [Candidatus Saccharimonadales bacterium]|jgi:MoCo/4Fe-4S cofactor protein with predicted Tat translocation signal|nr:TAT-variant-translocated molybdopterin oxidoreductase [Candidatus Saccharimonadales bacterium]